MHHVALDRPRPNDRDFDHDIVKTFRFHPRQRGHLRAALDLENADRVGVLHDLECFLVIFRNVRQIERPSAFTAKLERILHHRHHPEAEQIDFHDAEIFAIVLVPLRDHAARHRRVLQRHERTQFVLANDHSAGVLAEMTRQSVDRSIKSDERGHARMIFRQTGLLDLRFQIERVRKIAVREEMRETIENARRKIERFADLARRAAAAIRDHVRGHGGAMFAVAPINFLDHRFAPVATRKIEIDIGPAFPALVQKTFEDEMIADRIDRGDPETITNRAVRRAAAALDHDVVFAAEIDDVPDDQKISGEPELGDQRQFFFELSFYRRADRRVTLLRAEPNNRAQKRIHALTGRNRIRWKFVADIFERKREPLGQPHRVFDRFGQIREHFSHFAIALEMALGILG